jgi:hypothetical protein
LKENFGLWKSAEFGCMNPRARRAQRRFNHADHPARRGTSEASAAGITGNGSED